MAGHRTPPSRRRVADCLEKEIYCMRIYWSEKAEGIFDSGGTTSRGSQGQGHCTHRYINKRAEADSGMPGSSQGTYPCEIHGLDLNSIACQPLQHMIAAAGGTPGWAKPQYLSASVGARSGFY